MQAPETQSQTLKQLIDLRTKLESELKCTISHQKFVEPAVTYQGFTSEHSNIMHYVL